MIYRCDLIPQYESHKSEIDAAINRVLSSGRYVLADENVAFENEFSTYLGIKYAAGVASGTDGLILALKAMGIGKGDEVITTPFTAIPTVSAIIASGATPIFVDINPKTFLMDLIHINKRLSKKTKAVIAVHIFGNVVDILTLRKIIGKKVAIIEDAAQAHGSTINGQKAGTLGDMGVFSFYPTKNLGGYGDGGMVVSNNKKFIGEIKLLRMYGMDDKDHISKNGINSRLDELQAAILRVKLKYLDEMNYRRNKIANYYRTHINSALMTHQLVSKNIISNFHVFSSRININRNGFISYLNKKGIQTNIYYPIPVHLQRANKYLKYKVGDFPYTEKLCQEIVALPMYSELEMNKLKKLVNYINQYS